MPFIILRSRVRSAKVPSYPDKIHLCLSLPIGCLIGSVTEKPLAVLIGSISKLHRMDKRGLGRWDYCFPPADASVKKEYSTQERWCLKCGRMTQQWILAVVPSVLSQGPQIPDSPYQTLMNSALPPQEPRMSCCKQRFVCWPIKKVPVSLVESHTTWWTEIPLLFAHKYCVGASS